MKISLMRSQDLQHRQQLLFALICVWPTQKEQQLLVMGDTMNSTQELLSKRGKGSVNGRLAQMP